MKSQVVNARGRRDRVSNQDRLVLRSAVQAFEAWQRQRTVPLHVPRSRRACEGRTA